MGEESEERPQWAVCYRAEDETEGLDLEERRENKELKLSYMLNWSACFSGRVDWLVLMEWPELGAGIKGRV